MQVELIGCTGAGKSSLIRGLLQAYEKAGNTAVTGESFVLQQIRMDWLQNKAIRTLLVDACATVACLATSRKHSSFYRFATRTIVDLPASTGWLKKINMIRNT